MSKKLLSIILCISMIISAIAVTQFVFATYEYTYSFTSHGFAETIFDGKSVLDASSNFLVNLSVDDRGAKIPAEDIKYIKIGYYISSPDGVTSQAYNSTFYGQTLSTNSFTVTDSEGNVSKIGGTSGFVSFGNMSEVNEWAYTKPIYMSKIQEDVANNANYTEMYLSSFQLRPYFGKTLAEGEKVYLKDIKIYTVNPGTQTAQNGQSFSVNFYSDDTRTALESTEEYNSNISEYADVITMPQINSTKDGFSFVGWRKVGSTDILKVGDAYTFIDGKSIDFVGVWKAQKVYVSQNGNDTAFGTISEPVASLARAMEIIDIDEGGEIVIDGTIEYVNIPSHNCVITISGKNSDAVLSCNDLFKLNGSTVLSNITVQTPSGIFTYAKELSTNGVTLAELSLGGDKTIGGGGIPPKDEKAVVTNSTITTVYLGGVDDSVSYGTYTGTNTLYVNNSSIDTVYIGHQPKKDQLFAGDVNIIYDGSSTIGKITDNGTAIGWIAGAIQILANYGASTELDINTRYLSFGKWYMNSNSNGGLDVTDTEGVFTVNDGKTAIAQNTATQKLYYSVDGVLKVPNGTYNVSYVNEPIYHYNADKTQLIIDTSFVPDFELIERPQIEGKLFLGWVYQNQTAPKVGDELTAGTTLYAKLTDFDTSYGGDFYIEEPALRIEEGQSPALRFVVNASNRIDIPSAIYGTVSLPKIVVQNEPLVIGASYEYPYGSGLMHEVQNVIATNTYLNNDDGRKYTLCITGMPAAEYIRDICVRGYVSFTDRNGLERVEYTELATEGIYSLAKKNGNEEIMQAAKTAHEQYGETPVGVRLEQQTAHLETAHQANYTGTLFMVTNINLGLEKPIEFIAFGDQHFKTMDDYDRENPEIMYADRRRGANVNPLRRHYQGSQTIMEYAQMFDYTMSLGDTIDFYSHGSLEIAKQVLFEKDPLMLAALGYHDYVVYTINGRDSREFDQEAAKDMLRQYFKNDITYASYDVPDTPIKVVYMDDSRNGQFYYKDDIHTKLAADIADARANNRYIFIIKHEGTCTNNEETVPQNGFITGDPEDPNSVGYANYEKVINYKTQGGNVWFGTKPGTESYDQVKGTKAVYELIFSNADVIKGVFHGHVHANYVSEIQATYVDENNEVQNATIPQYSSMMNASPYGMGIKIRIS